MFKIKLKTLFSIITSKIILILSNVFFKGGSNFPGRVALKLDKDILSTVAKGYKVILVTGTNGKTTTTSMIYNILKKADYNVITNNTGANMLPGITACFIKHYKFKKTINTYAVIEADEANVKLITKYIHPEIITVTNIFRDQLDRYGEVYTTLNKILEGIKPTEKSTLVLNGDESMLGALELPNKTIYYGFNCSVSTNTEIDINSDAKFCKICKTPYKYKHITYNHLGAFYCENCGYKQPELKYAINDIAKLTSDESEFLINASTISLSQPGVYNIYNALCSYSVAKELGIEDSIIIDSLKNQNSHFGRQETIKIGSKEIKIILVKNPAGYNQAIDTLCLDKQAFGAAFLLNDNYADGKDVSWIWDVNFEKLSSINIKNIFISGIRQYDMATRLKIAGLTLENFKVCDNFENLLCDINNSDINNIYILATYTAMINFRKFLNSKGLIKKLW